MSNKKQNTPEEMKHLAEGKTMMVESVKLVKITPPEELSVNLEISNAKEVPSEPLPEWQSDPMYKQMMDAVFELYEPIDTAVGADVFITTAELIDKIQTMLPDLEIEKKDFNRYFRNLGYKFVVIGEPSMFDFYWILKYKGGSNE